MPWTRTWEWTTVLPEDHPMAVFTNGQVTQADDHGVPNSRLAVLYRRRVVLWRGRWRETGSKTRSAN